MNGWIDGQFLAFGLGCLIVSILFFELTVAG